MHSPAKRLLQTNGTGGAKFLKRCRPRDLTAKGQTGRLLSQGQQLKRCYRSTVTGASALAKTGWSHTVSTVFTAGSAPLFMNMFSLAPTARATPSLGDCPRPFKIVTSPTIELIVCVVTLTSTESVGLGRGCRREPCLCALIHFPSFILCKSYLWGLGP